MRLQHIQDIFDQWLWATATEKKEVVEYVKNTYGYNITPANWQKIYCLIKHDRRKQKYVDMLVSDKLE